MLINFTVKNFFSFYNKANLNFAFSPKESIQFKNNIIFSYMDNGRKKSVLNSMVIFGSNASGKSNLLKGIMALKNLLESGYTNNKVEDIALEVSPFRFKDNGDIELSISEILLKDSKYFVKYDIGIDPIDYRIKYEKLTSRKLLKTRISNDEKVIFERVDQEIVHADKEISAVIEQLNVNNNNYKPMLSIVVNNFNSSRKQFESTISSWSYQTMIMFYHEVVDNIVIEQNKSVQNKKIAEKLINDSNFKSELLNELRNFDFAISDFEVKDITQSVIANLVSLPESAIETLSRDKVYDIRTLHNVEGKKFKLVYDQESDGTLRFINQFINIYDCIRNGKTYICDEFENKYHPLIQRAIIDMFMNEGIDRRCQFIFTSHNVDLLNSDIFAKEQIQFIDKTRKTQDSELYGLDEFKEVSYSNHNWKNLYMDGRFGAI
ncbi:ATP-binding protein [Companilactobacillus allii]|uniref:ATPase AAA-type core domain-containing protein n=1 Tax=Companilactobacillus allii TaxID=1847728 RepID=A0A1P8Q263_9LACO|nr:ATP-binding protein [Companilactobacillus allii]APX71921.1 hypothetical protein BTM29_04840 [Companilactobacillus allii]USQ69015.1 ATP-binding protein [Companilactobacillus allii]